MVYVNVLNFVVAAGIVFVVINFMTPILYNFWYNNLESHALPQYVQYGRNLFFAWEMMGYIVPGILIAWGFAVAVFKGTDQQEYEV